MNRLILNCVVCFTLLISFVTSLRATPEVEATAKVETKPDAKEEIKYFEEPPLSVTTHTISIGGKTLKYHATAGYIVLKEEEGKPLIKSPGQKPPEPKTEAKSEEPTKTKDGQKAKAKVFFVAYVLDDTGETATRPLTFAFNGGAGLSFVLVHMALVAPRRADLTDDGEAP